MRNDPNDVDRVVASMRACLDKTLSPTALFNYETSVTEALTNLVAHATTIDPAAPIIIELRGDQDAIRVEICDPVGATPFDLRDHATLIDSVDPLVETGRGLGLILHCADHVTYGPKADGMWLTLTFSNSRD